MDAPLRPHRVDLDGYQSYRYLGDGDCFYIANFINLQEANTLFNQLSVEVPWHSWLCKHFNLVRAVNCMSKESGKPCQDCNVSALVRLIRWLRRSPSTSPPRVMALTFFMFWSSDGWYFAMVAGVNGSVVKDVTDARKRGPKHLHKRTRERKRVRSGSKPTMSVRTSDGN